MQFALVTDQRRAAEPRLKGICPACGSAVIAKCGHHRAWHWSHTGKRHCDPWWENETEWHRSWKSYFPEEQREIVHFDDTGEKHVADVKTIRGMVIEFQNSPITKDELIARELFYGRMFWIVNAVSFKDKFYILASLPAPEADMAQDLVFFPGCRHHHSRNHSGTFYRKSENPNLLNSRVELHFTTEIETDIKNNYKGHHLFEWIRPRDVWYEAKAPVFLDFGDNKLWMLQTYATYDHRWSMHFKIDDCKLRCVRMFQKEEVITKNGGTFR